MDDKTWLASEEDSIARIVARGRDPYLPLPHPVLCQEAEEIFAVSPRPSTLRKEASAGNEETNLAYRIIHGRACSTLAEMARYLRSRASPVRRSPSVRRPRNKPWSARSVSAAPTPQAA
jgi:hypothetical protein